jgi:hypothetical protein
MKRQPKRSKQRKQQLQLWTLPKAQAACAYIRSVIASLREHLIDTQTWKRQLQRLNERPGRPDRATLISQHETEHQLHLAEERLEQTCDELDAINIYVLDPLHGLALLPFVHDDQLAWYIFDLFDPKTLRFWRYQEDPQETRRPIASLPHGLGEPSRKG